MKCLKTSGLTQKTYSHCESLLKELPERSSIRQKLETWLQKHLEIQKKLDHQHPLPVSSDVIESLMGQIKQIIERNPITEFGRLTLAVPLMCGEQSRERMTSALASCSHKTMKQYELNQPTLLNAERQIISWKN